MDFFENPFGKIKQSLILLFAYFGIKGHVPPHLGV